MKTRLQCGAGLVEVAVALLVLSIGALGLARGQLAARQTSFEALQRSEAVFLAMGLLEQVRSNPAAMQFYQLQSTVEPVLPGDNCAQQACSAGQWGAWNRWQWWQELRGTRVRDAGGHAVGGLLQPLACVAIEHDSLDVRLSWKITPGTDAADCEGAIVGGTRGGLSLGSRIGEG